MEFQKKAESRAPAGAGALIVAATPIGNLGDVSTRLKSALREASRVAAEDTRRAGILLHSVGARASVISLHAHNERSRIAGLLNAVRQGEELGAVV